MKLLVANRGEIAIRIMRAAAELGVPTVAVAPADDAGSLHTGKADEAVTLDGAGAAAYLDVERIVAAALDTGCDALHPGYGFLAENAELARRCAAAGVTFVGPRVETLELFGDKARARAAAAAAGVPVVRGIDRGVTVEEAAAFLDALGEGRGMMIKAVAGGGGRGSRRVADADEVAAAYARCRAEAEAAFGNGALYVEEFVATARHVEVQILGDAGGAVAHLGERECSVQRNFQKIVEVAPAPGLADEARARIIDAAVRFAARVGYRNAGTFEFLVDVSEAGDGGFAFIETNARLQVEHTVTEEVTGVDIVRAQLELAQGRDHRGTGARGGGRAARTRGPGPGVHGVGAHRRRHPAGFRDAARLRAAERARGAHRRLRLRRLRDQPRLRLAARQGGGPFALGRLRRRRPPDLAGAGRVPHRGRRDQRRVPAGHPRPPGLRRRPRAHPLRRRAHRGTRRRGRTAALRHAIGSRPRKSRGRFRRRPGGRRTGPPRTLQTRHQGEIGAKRARRFAAHRAGRPAGPGARYGRRRRRGRGRRGACRGADGDDQRLGTAPRCPRVTPMHRRCGLRRRRRRHRCGGSAIPGHRFGGRGVLGRTDHRSRPRRPPKRSRASRRTTRVHRRRLPGREDRETACETATQPAGEHRAPDGRHVQGIRAPGDRGQLAETTVAAGDHAGGRPGDGYRPHQRRSVRSRPVPRRRRALRLHGRRRHPGGRGHYKQDRIYELAGRYRLPLVLFAEGGGGRPGISGGERAEVTDIAVEAGLRKPGDDPPRSRAGSVDVAGRGGGGVPVDSYTFTKLCELSGLVPLVGVNSGRCFAGNTVMLASCDVIIAAENSTIGLGGPAMIEGGGLGIYTPEEVGPMSFQVPNGVVDILVKDDEEAIETTRKYLSYFQGPVQHWDAHDQRRMRGIVPENRSETYDMREVIATLVDKDSILEIREAFGVGIITAFIRIEGRPMGLIANNPQHLSGAIDSDAADKGARFLQLCDTFDIPVLSLMDCPGIMPGPEYERAALLRHCARLFVTGANMTTPLFGVVIRKAYGMGVRAMCGGSSLIPFFTVAWPTAEFADMPIDGRVKVMFGEELETLEDPAERQAIYERLIDAHVQRARAVNSGGTNYGIDDVIDPADTRAWIAQGLQSVPKPAPRTEKKRPNVDTW